MLQSPSRRPSIRLRSICSLSRLVGALVLTKLHHALLAARMLCRVPDRVCVAAQACEHHVADELRGDEPELVVPVVRLGVEHARVHLDLVARDAVRDLQELRDAV